MYAATAPSYHAPAAYPQPYHAPQPKPQYPSYQQPYNLQPFSYYSQFTPRAPQYYTQNQNFTAYKDHTIKDYYTINRNLDLVNRVNIQPIINVNDTVNERVVYNQLPPIFNYNKPVYSPIQMGQQPPRLNFNLGSPYEIQAPQYQPSYGGHPYGGGASSGYSHW